MFYEGRNERSRSLFVFSVNGKGEWGDGECWDDGDWRIAADLAAFICDETDSMEPCFEGDGVWSVCDRDWDIGGWKEDVIEAYRIWKRERLPLFA